MRAGGCQGQVPEVWVSTGGRMQQGSREGGEVFVAAGDSDRTDKSPHGTAQRFFFSPADLCSPSMAVPKHLPWLGIIRRDGVMEGENRRPSLQLSLEPAALLYAA